MQKKKLAALTIAAAGVAAAPATGGVALADDGANAGTEVVIDHGTVTRDGGGAGGTGVAREDCPEKGGGSGGTEPGTPESGTPESGTPDSSDGTSGDEL